jgi:3-isopropylmalate/(R)-2-methylmalate dehydratase small subunit
MEKTKGKVVWKFGEHFNADLIVGSKNIGERNIEVLGKVFMADFDPNLVNRVKRGDILVAARNFGYGHPHQQSIQSIKKAGISTVIAESFFPAWYRMAFFHSLPLVVCPNILKAVDVDQDLEVDFVTGNINNITTAKTFQAEPIPPFLLDVLKSGGLVPWLRKQPIPRS